MFRRSFIIPLKSILLTVLLSQCGNISPIDVSVVDSPDTGNRNAWYPSNQQPLSPNALVKLPLGSVQAEGWLGHQLELMTGGMTGHLMDISEHLTDDNGWFGTDNRGWEEQPYWLRGFYPMAVLTGNERHLAEAQRWIEAVLSSQDEDGYFGAPMHKREAGTRGRYVADLWPHMVMLDVLRQYYEVTNDPRVIPLMEKFFTFCSQMPDEEFIPHIPGAEWQEWREDFGSWKIGVQVKRSGEMLPHIYWLFNQNNDTELLKTATRFYDSNLPPVSEWLDDHIVNFTQRFAYFGIYGQQSNLARGLAETEFWYRQHLSTWGQQPRGIFAADELIRPGKTDPRQAFETCGMVEFPKKFYELGRITGSAEYADRTEDILFNHFPAAQMPDLKGLHYLTASNQPQLDASGRHDYSNKRTMISYSPHNYRCCQHNHAQGWPSFTENLWQATPDNGLCAWMYAPSTVTAKVGESGSPVTIHTETDYPFKDTIQMTIQDAVNVPFALYLRVPKWCEGFTVSVNGELVHTEASPQTYIRIERTWNAGDRINIGMPMELALTEWPRTRSVTVDRGPLSYSVRIEEYWQRHGGTDEWPEWEVFPAGPWNYGLSLNTDNPLMGMEVVEQPELADQPWTIDNAPVSITVSAKRIANWKLENETVQPLQRSPIRSDAPEERITMIPLGCARLRMACLPVIGDGPDAGTWK
jgi:hypothetical protein